MAGFCDRNSAGLFLDPAAANRDVIHDIEKIAPPRYTSCTLYYPASALFVWDLCLGRKRVCFDFGSAAMGETSEFAPGALWANVAIMGAFSIIFSKAAYHSRSKVRRNCDAVRNSKQIARAEPHLRGCGFRSLT